MRLDATDLRYVSADEFRVLTAVEIGSKNHEVVPTPLIAELSGIRSGIVLKCIGALAKRDLVARVQGAKYDGYRLTYGGLDYLSLRTFSRRKIASVSAVGKKIGVGKESDIYLVKGEGGEERVLKLHRLGRISFRAIKTKRDYLGKRQSASWMYMSRLAAQKEFVFMKVLYENGFPVPVPIDQSRHCIVMSLIDSYPLRQVDVVESPSELYSTLMTLLLRLAHCGLIHGDYNEFNILIHRKTGEATIIDFPQMVSTRHKDAEYYFNRDVNCIRKFFRKRFRYEAESWPRWRDVLAGEDDDEVVDEVESGDVKEGEGAGGEDRPIAGEGEKAGEGSTSGTGKVGADQPAKKRRLRLDLEVEASGFGGALQEELEEYMNQVGDLPASDGEDYDDEDEDNDDEEEEEEYPDHIEGQDPTQGHLRPHIETSSITQIKDETSEQHLSDQIEAICLSKALGNTSPTSSTTSSPRYKTHNLPSPPPSDDSEDDDSDDSQAPPPTDYTSFTPASRGVKPPRLSVKKLGKRDEVAARVEREMGGKAGGGSGRGGGGGKVDMGRGKGHKWKTSSKYLLDKGGNM